MAKWHDKVTTDTPKTNGETNYVGSAVWELKNKVQRESRPYHTSDFEKKYFIPNL